MNPHQSWGEWKGRWSEGSEEWTDEYKEALESKDIGGFKNGSFFMEWEDIVKHFDGWGECSAKGNFGLRSYKVTGPHGIFKFRVPKFDD